MDERVDFNVYPFMKLIYDLDVITMKMVVGEIRLMLPDLYDKSDSSAPVSVKILPAESSTDADSVKFLKSNNKVVFKNNAFSLDYALPLDILIYSED